MTDELSGATEILKSGSALVRFSDDQMMGVAIQRRRDVPKVRTDVLAEIEAFPEYADRYFYSIPYKTNKCGDHAPGKICPHCTFVEGASIHAALAIQRAWGNSFSSWSPREETDLHIWIDGTFVDYESNNKWVRPTRFEKGYTRARDKQWIPLKGEKLVKAMNAAGSKAQRNAILAGVPDALKIMVFTRAKELVVGDTPAAPLTEKQLEAIRVEFAKFEVPIELLETKLGKPIGEWVMRDRATLLGIRTALSDGEARQDIFGSTVARSESKPVKEKKPKKKKTKAKPKPVPEEDLPLAGTATDDPDEGMATHEQSDLAEATSTEEVVAAAVEVVKEADAKEPDPFTANLFGDD